MSYKNRVLRMQEKMLEKGYDILILTDPGSLRYVSGIYAIGYHQGDAIIIPSSGDIYRVLSIGERGRHEVEGWIKNLLYWIPPFAGCQPKKFIDVISKTIIDLAGQNCVIGVEKDLIPWAWLDKLEKKIKKCTFLNVTMEVKNIMAVKDDEEVQWVRKVAGITEIGFEAALKNIEPGKLETEIAAIADEAMMKAGASYVYMPTLVCSDKRVIWDQPPKEKLIEKGDVVKIDVHPVYKEYRGDYHNTVSMGKPTNRLKQMSNATAEAARKMISKMKPGVLSKELDYIFRKTMSLKGFDDLSCVYLGHGLGTTHLPPFISQNDNTVLQKNMLIVINPFCYKPEEEGIVMEYMCLITESGVELLNKGPLNLIEISG